MKIEIATLFPEMCEAVLGESIVGRARKAGKIEIHCRQIREYTHDKHRRVDDTPYGGGMGMVMQCEPIYNCYQAVCNEIGTKPHTIYMSPKGKIFTQQRAVELSKMENILIICGHYEGVDQRIIDRIVDEEISIGDYVLTGGEIPAMAVVDAVARMCDGVLSDEACFKDESIYSGLLEYPQYTRPEVWEGERVPAVLLSGHHKNIEKWRLEKSIEITAERRPDLLELYENSKH
ncbi:MAG: tRNA (guanosine(37)-N1)-methyltransferase TrmD [Ruminococcus sp.]|nr:tRNA (guanosine(37)-N1)-methyltransferase TrmD [Ruminococcus sp.]